MDASVACRSGQSMTGEVSGLRRAALAALCLAACPAFAVDGDDGTLTLAQAGITSGGRSRPQLELSTSSLPRFENTDGSNRSSRLDMTWLPPRRSALGLSLGMSSADSTALVGPTPLTGLGTNVDLGVHWRYTVDGNNRFDVTAYRRLLPPDALTMVQTREASYGARVEMQVGSSPKSGFAIDRGFVGLQLESGARVTLRRSGGKPMMYYRSKF